MTSLSGDVATLRAAVTSLTKGVVKSLQIVGLLEDSPWAMVEASSTGDMGRPDQDPAAIGGKHAGETSGMDGFLRGGGREAETPTAVKLEDLLRWENTGHSLASCVSRQWREREAPGAPTILAALDRRLQVE